MDYRKDIDGLRAIAVLAVLLFHSKVPFFEGGYLGVDIFFQISGFLITLIILKSLGDGTFSLTDFYERRIRRILPALMALLVIMTPIFYSFMLPDDLENYGQSVVATLLFANNILLLATSGYFDTSSDLKPLTHTWSLGVEEQYYVIIPILMMMTFRWGGLRTTIFSIAALTITSFLFAVVVSRYNENFNFYMLTSRFWQLGAGSLAAFVYERSSHVKDRAANFLSSLGLIAIIASILTQGDVRGNPNEWTLIPVVGVCMILLFSRPGTLSFAILSTRALVFIGLISYSLYLWHQPLFVLLRLTSLDEPVWTDYLPYTGVAFVMAVLSWKFVETPFRHKNVARERKSLFLGTGVTAGGLLVIGATFHLTSGFYSRWPELAERDAGFGAKQNIAYNLRVHELANRPLDKATRSRNVLVVGNSFARDVINLLRSDPTLAGLNISYVENTDYCLLTLDRALVANAQYIIFGSGVRRDTAACVQRQIHALSATGEHRYFVTGMKNFGWNNNAVMLLPETKRYAYRARVNDPVIHDNLYARTLFAPDAYVDFLTVLGADVDGRVPVFSPDRKFLSQDREHFTVAGARYVADLLANNPLFVELRSAAAKRDNMN